jgi:hypothetical protein
MMLAPRHGVVTGVETLREAGFLLMARDSRIQSAIMPYVSQRSRRTYMAETNAIRGRIHDVDILELAYGDYLGRS